MKPYSDLLFGGLEYLPGDVIVSGNFRGRILATSNRHNASTSVSFQDMLERERRSLADARGFLGREEMDCAVARQFQQNKAPKKLFYGRNFGDNSLHAENPLFAYLDRILFPPSSLDAEEWARRDHTSLVFLGIFSALLGISMRDYSYARRLWPLLWKKSDATPHIGELFTYHDLLFSGISVQAVPEGSRKTPDFKIATSKGQIYLERKAITHFSVGEEWEVCQLIEKYVMRLVEGRRFSFALGIRGRRWLTKSGLVEYKLTIRNIAETLANGASKHVRCIVGSVEFTGVCFRDPASFKDIPEGYVVGFDMPLVEHGFSMEAFIGGVVYDDDGGKRQFVVAYDTLFFSWSEKDIEKVLSRAEGQACAHGQSLIQISFPSEAASLELLEQDIDRAFCQVRKWWSRNRHTNLNGVLVTFRHLEMLGSVSRKDKIGAIRTTIRNERILKPNSLLGSLPSKELEAWSAAFPRVAFDLFSLE